MPARLVPLVNGEYYHLLNRGINKQPIFFEARNYKRAIETFKYYSFAASLQIKFSKFLKLSNEQRNILWDEIENKGRKLVEIVCFCLMPNHFHFLLLQKEEKGISKFMANFQNSYTKYFNTKYQKFGPILQGQFKAVRIEDDSQLLHLTRYIHLNPYTSFVVKDVERLLRYPWSSFKEYLEKIDGGVCHKQIILENFKSLESFKKFVFDRADYQRELEKIKHLTIEK